MTPEQRQVRIDELVQKVVRLPRDSHEEFLNRNCADDPDIRDAVAKLVEAYDQKGTTTFQRLKTQPSPEQDQPAERRVRDPLLDKQVGPYRLRRRLGRGGFGNVYLGERTGELKQKVAVKLIRPDKITEEKVLQRFDLERQALADFQHANIARFLDGGSTEEGWPFFVMEYVEGERINKYCDHRRLSIEQRVRLFQDVCAAINYAHGFGYIHRDIKPSNVLVNSDGEPKVLDFGIAKLVDPRSRRQEITLTERGVVATPEFASPEQIRGERRRISTASDVYSLGVVLYQLLTGHHPYRLDRTTISELERIVCEEQPRLPSEVVTQNSTHQVDPESALANTVACARSVSVAQLQKILRGDLDTIVLKALHKEPSRRYGSAAELAEDLGDYLSGLPIRARRDSGFYRAKKFVQRYRGSVLAATLVFLSLAVGVVSTTVLWFQAADFAEKYRDEADNVALLAEQYRISAANEAVARQEAERDRANLQRALYRSQMNLAPIQWEKGDVVGLQTTLDRISSAPDLAALRGFEWYYYAASTKPYVKVFSHGSGVTDVAISSDGGLVASCGDNRQILVWDGSSGELLRRVSLKAGQFLSLDFSPISGRLAAGSSDGWVRIWEPAASAEPFWEQKHGPAVTCVQFSNQGDRLLTSGDFGAIRVWDIAEGSRIAQIPTGKNDTRDVRFLPNDEKIVFVKSDGLVRIGQIGDEKIVQAFEPHPVLANVAISDDGATLVTGSNGGSLRMYTPNEDVVRSTYNIELRTGDMEFMKDEPVLVVLAAGGNMILFDTQKQEEIQRLTTHSLTFGSLARSADGRFMVVGSGDGTVRLVRTDELVRRSVLWHDADVRSLAYLPDGERVVAASSDGDLRIWNLETGAWQPLRGAEPIQGTRLALQPNGELIAVYSVGGQLILFDLVARRIVHRSAGDSGIISARFSASGGQLALTYSDGSVSLFVDSDWSNARHRIPPRPARVTTLVFAPDEKQIVFAYDDGDIIVHSVKDETDDRRIMQIDSTPRALTVCDSGRILAVASDNGEIHLYDMNKARLQTTIKGHVGRIHALAVLPNQTTLVSGGRDKVLRLWDVESGQQLTSLAGHLRQIFSIAASPQGDSFVSGGLEGDVRIWRGKTKVDPDETLAKSPSD